MTEWPSKVGRPGAKAAGPPAPPKAGATPPASSGSAAAAPISGATSKAKGRGRGTALKRPASCPTWRGGAEDTAGLALAWRVARTAPPDQQKFHVSQLADIPGEVWRDVDSPGPGECYNYQGILLVGGEPELSLFDGGRA